MLGFSAGIITVGQSNRPQTHSEKNHESWDRVSPFLGEGSSWAARRKTPAMEITGVLVFINVAEPNA